MPPVLSRLFASAALCAAALPAAAQETVFPATLAGHAVLPALSLIAPPADAPQDAWISGKFTGPARNDQPMSVMGDTGASHGKRATGLALPFIGQPLQGMSGFAMETAEDGSIYVLTDNGFGAKANSADAMLMFHQVKPDWNKGGITRVQTQFLHDPDRKVPFLIVNEGTDKRYLTGADLDVESMQIIDGEFWFGDELGPYLIRADRQGRVLAVFETQLDGKTLKSPDHFSITTPAVPGTPVTTPVRRSRGYEGMAASRDGRFLYPLLEGPLWVEADKKWETDKDGREYLRVLEFDVKQGAWTGRSWKYALELKGNNIGDFNMIDADTGLIIERDNGEGLAEDACNGPARPDCQNIPARFKRVYKISLKDADADGFVKKIGYVDLMDIADPKGVAKRGGKNGRFTFPFVTIENVDVVDAEHIVVANDNNLPYSSARKPNLQDDNEFILLKVPELLKAR